MPPHRQVGWVALNLLLHTLATSRGDTRPSWLQLSQVTTARRPSVFLPSSEMQLFPFDKSLRIAYERFSFAHIAAVFAMGTLATFGYGAFLIIGGVVTDPAAEFEKLEQGCYIKSFTVERMHTNQGCDDVYTFTFCQTTNRCYTSRKFPKNACKRNSCESCKARTEPIYNLSQTVDCWRRLEGQGRDSLKWLYECGNSECYKIFDPADDPSHFFIMGLFLTCFGSILSFVCGGFAQKELRRQRNDRNQSQSESSSRP